MRNPRVLSLLCLGFLTLSGCIHSLLESPKITLQEIKVKKMSVSQVFLEVVLTVKNPNRADITVDHLKYILEVNKKNITSGAIDEDVTIPGHGQKEIALPLTVKYTDVLSSATKLLQNQTVPYRVQGSVNVGPFNIPFDKAGELKASDL